MYVVIANSGRVVYPWDNPVRRWEVGSSPSESEARAIAQTVDGASGYVVYRLCDDGVLPTMEPVAAFGYEPIVTQSASTSRLSPCPHCQARVIVWINGNPTRCTMCGYLIGERW